MTIEGLPVCKVCPGKPRIAGRAVPTAVNIVTATSVPLPVPVLQLDLPPTLRELLLGQFLDFGWI